jgi:gluconolactonase
MSTSGRFARTGAVLTVALLVTASMAAQQPPPAPVGVPQAQPPLPPARVIVLDPAMSSLVEPDAAIERWDMGYGFVEGPVWTRDGALLFSDIPGNTIFRTTADRKTTVFRKPSGYDAVDRRPGQHVGSNGLTLDREGRLIVAEHGNRRVSRIDAGGRLTVIADRFDGKRLNSPNDVIVKSDGTIYFTDPPYGLPLQDKDPAKEIPFSGIYRIRNGTVELLASELARPNGMAFTPDERFLIVANAENDRKIWMRYELKPDGTLNPGTLLLDATKEPMGGIPDGLKIDSLGNIYATGPGGVWVMSPQGTPLGRIELPELPANVAFGDDGRMLYMTARTSIYRIRVTVQGLRACCP